MRYCAFATTFEAMEAFFFQQEKVLQFPGHHDLMDNIDPAEFIAEENLSYKEMSVDEGVGKDDEIIKTSNLPSPPAECHHLRLFAADPSSSIPHLTTKKMRT